MTDSKTPRTDAVAALSPASCGMNELAECHNRMLAHARSLERELLAMTEERDKYLYLYTNASPIEVQLYPELDKQLLACQERLRVTVGALHEAAMLYDDMALGPMGGAAKYGDDWPGVTDERCLQVRAAIDASLRKDKP